MFSKWFKASNSSSNKRKIPENPSSPAKEERDLPLQSPDKDKESKLNTSLRSVSSTSENFYWMHDEQCTECFNCHQPFTPLHRRHHCRQCGRIFCGNCSSYRINTIASYIYSKLEKKRLCGFCYNSLSSKITKQSLLHKISRNEPRVTRAKVGLSIDDEKLLGDGITKILHHHSKYFNDFSDPSVHRMINIAIEINKNINPSRFLGDHLDIRNYVNTVCIVDDCAYENFQKFYCGVAFTCTLTSACPAKQIQDPKVLLVGCRISYERSNSYSLLNSVVKQQQQYLNILVSRILKLNPDIIIFKHAVPTAIREAFERHNKILLGDVNYSRLKAISRCTGATILKSTDEIGFAQLGLFKTFSIENYNHLGSRITVAIVDGCSPDLFASTILIHSSEIEIARIRRTFISILFFTRLLMDELVFMKYLLPKLDFSKINQATHNLNLPRKSNSRLAHRRNLTGDQTSTSTSLQFKYLTKENYNFSNTDDQYLQSEKCLETNSDDVRLTTSFDKNCDSTPLLKGVLPCSLFYSLNLSTKITLSNLQPIFCRNVWKMSPKLGNRNNKLKCIDFSETDDVNEVAQYRTVNRGDPLYDDDSDVVLGKLDMKPNDLANIPTTILNSLPSQMAIFRACGRFPSLLMLYSDHYHFNGKGDGHTKKSSSNVALNRKDLVVNGGNEDLVQTSSNEKYNSHATDPHPPLIDKPTLHDFSQQTFYSADQYQFELELFADLLVLYYCYSISSKIYPLYCVKPCIRQLKYYSASDSTLLSFLMNHCFKASANCGVPLCERAYNMHSIVYAHDTTKIVVRLPKYKHVLKSNLLKNNIVYNYVKCGKCGKKSSYRKMPHESLNIPFSVFLSLIIYSKHYLSVNFCENCPTLSQRPTKDSCTLYFQYNQNITKFKVLSMEPYVIGCVSFNKAPKTGINVLINDLQFTHTNIKNALEEIKKRFDKNFGILPDGLRQKTSDFVAKIDNFLNDFNSNISKLFDVMVEGGCGQASESLSSDTNAKSISINKTLITAFYLDVIYEIKKSKELTVCLGFENVDAQFGRSDCPTKPTTPLVHRHHLISASCPNLLELELESNPSVKLVRSFSLSPELSCSISRNNRSHSAHHSKSQLYNDLSAFSYHEVSSKLGPTNAGNNKNAKSAANDTTSPALLSTAKANTKFPMKNSTKNKSENKKLNQFLKEINPLSKLTRVVIKTNFANPHHVQNENTNSGAVSNFSNFSSNSPNHIINIGDPGRIASLAIQTLNQSAVVEPGQNYNQNFSIGLAYREGFFDVAVQVSDTCKYVSTDPTVSNSNHWKVEFDTNEDYVVCNVFWKKDFSDFRNLLSKHGHITEESYLESLDKCIIWKAPSGKSGSNFFKSYDNRLIIKELTSHEFECLQEFIINYINYVSSSLREQRPCFLVKIFGAYEIICKGSHNYRLRFIVMENLLHSLPFVIDPNKLAKQPLLKDYLIFDLKGVHNAKQLTKSTPYVCGTIGTDAQLLIMSQNEPFYCFFQSGSIFQRAIERDTAFLSHQSIMDYSLLVCVDKVRKTINVGIIDFLRKYTWDKRLESVVKASVMMRGSNIIGGGPTVIHPEEYRIRFVEKMKSYFPPVPDKFSKYEADFVEENRLFIVDDDCFLSALDNDKANTPFWFHELIRMKTN